MDAPVTHRKLVEAREMLFAASQNLWLLAGVLRDREMTATATSVGDMAEMLGEFSSSLTSGGEEA